MTERISLTPQIAAVEAELADRRAIARSKAGASRVQNLDAALRSLRWLSQNAPRLDFACGAISLSRQISAIDAELRDRRASTRAKLSTSQLEYQLGGLEAAANTLRWLRQHEARIKGVMGQ